MLKLEQSLQRGCTAWLKMQYPNLVWFKIDNEGKRSKIAGAIAKACGLLKGMPDNGLIINGITYYFEFKAPSGKLSESQILTHQKLQNNGVYVYIIYDIEHFVITVKSLI
jgi:hypothetical protein